MSNLSNFQNAHNYTTRCNHSVSIDSKHVAPLSDLVHRAGDFARAYRASNAKLPQGLAVTDLDALVQISEHCHMFGSAVGDWRSEAQAHFSVNTISDVCECGRIVNALLQIPVEKRIQAVGMDMSRMLVHVASSSAASLGHLKACAQEQFTPQAQDRSSVSKRALAA